MFNLEKVAAADSGDRNDQYGAKQSCYVIISVNIYHDNHFMTNNVTIIRENGFATNSEIKPSFTSYRRLPL